MSEPVENCAFPTCFNAVSMHISFTCYIDIHVIGSATLYINPPS